MKVKCQHGRATIPCKQANDRHCDMFDSHCEMDIEIPTADLIAELEKRRPCERCAEKGREDCIYCFWDHVTQSDNFKAYKAKEGGHNGK